MHPSSRTLDPASTLRERARALLDGNTRRAVVAGRTHTFTVPSVRAYPFQWFWDSCFHAIAWTHLDHDRSRAELRALVAWQRPDGYIPHVIFWDRRRALSKPWHFLESRPWLVAPGLPISQGKPATSEMMQPPVLAMAVQRAVEATGDAGFLAEMLPSLAAYHRALAAQRDPDGDGLVAIIAPSESGMDFSPQYDAAFGLSDPGYRALTVAMRRATWRNKWRSYDLDRIFRADRFVVADALVNACRVADLDALASLAGDAGDQGTAAWAGTERDRATGAMLEQMWDPEAGAFWSLAGAEKRPLRVLTVAALCGLLLPELPRSHAEALVRQLRDDQRFGAPYGVPSVARGEPAFRANSHVEGRERIWRGTTWINTNWLLVQGLRRHGYTAEADEVADASVRLVEGSGFFEHFNALTGAGHGAADFGWSTLAIDLDRRAGRDRDTSS